MSIHRGNNSISYQVICLPVLGLYNQGILQLQQPLHTSLQRKEKGQRKQLFDLLFPQQRRSPTIEAAIKRQWSKCRGLFKEIPIDGDNVASTISMKKISSKVSKPLHQSA